VSNDKPYFVIRSLSKPSDLTPVISQGMIREKRRLLKQRRKERGKEANLTIPDGISNFVHTAQMAVVQDLLTVIAHVRKLFAGGFSEQHGFIEILKEFESTAYVIELGVIKHGFLYVGKNEEYEEISFMENLLADHGNYEFTTDGPESGLLSWLSEFWLNEIKFRVNDLIELLTVCPAYEQVTKSYSALNEITFPKYL